MKWEYRFARLADTLPQMEAKMNELGEQGWEAVAMHIQMLQWVLLLKRPKSD